MRKHLVFAILLFLFCGICPAEADNARPYRLTSTDCGDLPAIVGQECYLLNVRENRNNPDSRFIEVFVVVLRALDQKPAGKPTVFLHGGPGNVGTQLIDKFNVAEFRRDHDLVFFDQRGLGHSKPAIKCEYLNTLLKTDPLVIGKCLGEFKAAKADIRGYDTRQSALDLKELRQGLGIGQWNVYGVSYGTRYALDLMRVDPEGTACLVLDSPMTTSDPNNTTDINLTMKSVLERMFQDCKAQDACNQAYPDLEKKFYAITDHIKDHPIVIKVKNPLTGVKVPFVRTADDYTSRIGNIIGSQDYAKRGPSLIDKMHRHVTGQSVMTAEQMDLYFANVDPSTFAKSMYWGIALGVYCREIYPVIDFAALDIARDAIAPFGILNQDESLWRTACPMAAAGEIEPGFLEPVTGDKPVLILAGTYDTMTPRAWAEKAARTLSRVTFVTIPAAGHALFDAPCPRKLMADFLDNPSTKLDAGCVSKMPEAPVFDLK